MSECILFNSCNCICAHTGGYRKDLCKCKMWEWQAAASVCVTLGDSEAQIQQIAVIISQNQDDMKYKDVAWYEHGVAKNEKPPKWSLRLDSFPSFKHDARLMLCIAADFLVWKWLHGQGFSAEGPDGLQSKASLHWPCIRTSQGDPKQHSRRRLRTCFTVWEVPVISRLHWRFVSSVSAWLIRAAGASSPSIIRWRWVRFQQALRDDLWGSYANLLRRLRW